MVTRGAVYVLRDKIFFGIRLRHHFSLLHCKIIKQTKKKIQFVMPAFNDVSNIIKIRNITNIDQNESDDETDFEAYLIDNLDNNNDTDTLLQKNKKSIQIDNEKLKDDFEITVFTSHSKKLAILISNILNDIIDGLGNNIIKKPLINAKVALPHNDKRKLKYSLSRRAIFLAHESPSLYYFTSKVRYLNCSNYFKAKWDGGETLTIGKQFHPTIFGKDFGKAVGLEPNLKTVLFHGAIFSEFSKFLESLVAYSYTIEKIVFLDYSREKLLNFSLNLNHKDCFTSYKEVDETKVTKWWFIKTCANIVLSFMDGADQLSHPFQELLIGKYSYNNDDARSIFIKISRHPVLTRIDTLKLISIKFQDFPFHSFISMLSSFQCLGSLYIKGVNCDGNKILAAICLSSPYIHQISLIKMRFEEDTFKNASSKKLKFPDSLVSLDISKSQFVNYAFASFLSSITHVKTRNPFIFIARKLQIGEDEFSFLNPEKGYLNINESQPNFLEFNFSHNYIPILDYPFLFEFLKTQTRMQQIIFNDVSTDDNALFANQIVQLCVYTGVRGVDLSVHFEQPMIQVLISMLATCKNLTRLCLKNCGAGNDGLITANSLFNLLDNLKEFACDGFRPQPLTQDEINNIGKMSHHPLLELWKKIGLSKSIERNDWPSQDLAISQLSFDDLNPNDKKWVEKLNSRKPPTTQQERINLLLDQLRTSDTQRRNDINQKTNDSSSNEYEYEYEYEEDK